MRLGCPVQAQLGRDSLLLASILPLFYSFPVSLFRTDSLSLYYSDVEAARQWWCRVFDGKAAKVPADWDDSLPSDINITLPSHQVPTVLLSNVEEVKAAGYDLSAYERPILFCDRIKRAFEYLSDQGVIASPIESDGETQYFTIRDCEGHEIEICKEP